MPVSMEPEGAEVPSDVLTEEPTLPAAEPPDLGASHIADEPFDPTGGTSEPDDPDSHPAPGERDADEPPPAFDPRCKEDFEGLMYLGALQRTFRWAGHRFTIRTIGTDALLAVGQVTATYANTMGNMKAYQTAIVAACLLSVDDQPLPMPIERGGDIADLIRYRFDWVCGKWFPPVIDVIYGMYLELEARVDAAMEALGEAQG